MAAFSQASEFTLVGLTHKVASFDSTTNDIGGHQGANGESARKETSDAFRVSNGPERKLPDIPRLKQRVHRVKESASRHGSRLVKKVQFRIDKYNANQYVKAQQRKRPPSQN
ncbi:hypothetical protein AC1031_006685 [Aphanomyces cochlioides]|nr:hypothetical protein AC1031_006685 [Aphanomyces cochlioides]